MNSELKAKLDRAFNPRTVAVVGDKGVTGYRWLKCLENFKGEVYSVNIDKNEFEGIAALGIKNYLSLTEIPVPIDFAICAVPREVSPIVLRDAIKKEVGAIALFTSGFSETQTEKGIQLEQTITQMAKDANQALVGPNCMGIYVPGIGLRFGTDQPEGVSGPVGFISQSGTHGGNFGVLGGINGIYMNKVVSFGNGVILEATDYFEYFAQDPEIKVIALYIEGLKDGRRFFEALRETTPKKPVLIWKGGQTEDGARATKSHTSSLAEPMVIWEAMFKQTGAIRVDCMEDLIDSTKAILTLPPVTGNRVGLISMTGGQSVVTTDAFAKAGLKVPVLSDQSYEKLASFFNVVGGSYRNPIDMGQNWAVEESISNIFDILNDDPNVDSIVLELSINFLQMRFKRNPQLAEMLFAKLRDYASLKHKPLLVTLPTTHLEVEVIDFRNRLTETGVPTFPTFARAAAALKNVVDYYRFIQS